MNDSRKYDSTYDSAIALVGMAGRFPGAPDVETFWHNLAAGISSIRPFSHEELLAAGLPPALLANEQYVKVGAPVEDIDLFDASFFGYTPREAETMDPQHRLLLECCWQALEQAGYDPFTYPGLVGVFTGSAFSQYYLQHIVPDKDLIDSIGQLQIDTGNERDSLSSMVSYKLNLRGPAIAVQTFCSTSLVAVHLACQSLLNYECDLALAGGVSLQVPNHQGYLYEPGGILSPDGQCRTFDAQAQGSVLGSGLGVVTLKRFSDAREEGDTIYALLRGSAITNDGSLRVSYTAPSPDGQARAILAALSFAQVSADSLSYIEAHGTATPLGDSVELAALRKAFAAHTARQQFCALGSVKPNVGHLDRAAGVTGLIKTALALFHRQIPPSLQFEQPHPESDLEHSPFYVNTRLLDWPAGPHPRRAGVSSFGLGGTNVHVILEEPPEPTAERSSHGWHLLPLSARSETALQQMRLRLAAHLRAHSDLDLADVAFTLQSGRCAFSYREAILCRDLQDALTRLEQRAEAARTDDPLLDELTNQQLIQMAKNEATRAEGLDALGKLWVAGAAIEWQQLYTHEHRRRVPLPTYPFERQRFWLRSPAKRLQSVTEQQNEKNELEEWFYLPAWEKVEPAAAQGRTTQAETWLMFLNEHDPGELLAARLEQAGQTVARVYAGTQLSCLDTRRHTYRIRPGERSDYTRLFQDLAEARALPHHIIHAWNIGLPDASTQLSDEIALERGFYSLLYLVQALNEQPLQESIFLNVLTSHAQAVAEDDTVDPLREMLPSVCKVIPQEYTHIICRSLDIDWSEATGSSARFADQLWAELRSQDADPALAYRDGTRLVQRYQHIHLDETHGSPARLRQQGVYLITGGLGKIGLALAETLVRTVQARLVLVGRTALPPREQWPAWLADHAADERASQQIQRIQHLEALGGSVMLCQADVADVKQLANAFGAAEKMYGRIHGVIHAAGITDEAAFPGMHRLSRADCELHFRPKVAGLFALAQVLQTRSPDFCLLCSSLSTVLGGIGLAAYSAANACMDAFAHQQHRAGRTFWLSIDWDTWQFPDRQTGIAGSTTLSSALSPAEGATVLTRALGAPALSRLIISTSSLAARLRQWIMLEDLRAASGQENAQGGGEQKPLRRSDYTRILTAIWQEMLGISNIGLYDNFFDLGGNSLTGIQVAARIRNTLHVQLPVVALFEAPSVNAMTDYLLTLQETRAGAGQAEQTEAQQLARRRELARRQDDDEIVIIGMSGRFPGAANVEQFWENLRAGVESITFFSEEELLAAGVDPARLEHPDYVRARPVLNAEQVECFDAAFFGYSPRDAELLDPQHRLFLECCWEALERGGYDPQRYPGQVGVFGGANISTYLHALLKRPALLKSLQEVFNDYQVATSMDKDALTTLVSYKLGLTGPSMAVQTFCSTSLVAVHLACQSLKRGECDIALAGGVSVRVPSKEGHLYQEGGQESPDGHCRAFDARAQGSMFGDGCGVVALKRRADALADGDVILALIKGSAINNDGALKVSYTAPGVVGQAAVVTAALGDAQVPAESISYIEAHGTGTELGDPIEIASLTRAYRAQTDRTQFCAIGSVKTNIGHLDRASGISGLIKTVLAFQHEEIPASLHYTAPNPQIDFAHSPFYVNSRLTPWKRGAQVRRAAVNSLGMGGTNAHLVLEEGPEPEPACASRPWQLLLLSARTATALETASQNLGAYFQSHPELNLADAAYTLQVGRSVFSHRRMLVCQSTEGAARALLEKEQPLPLSAHDEQRERPVAFLFPDDGEQFSELGIELYLQERVFRTWVDRCCDILEARGEGDLRGALFSVEPLAAGQRAHDLSARLQDPAYHRAAVQAATVRLRQAGLAQPATFIMEYALARLFMHWGVQPQAIFGHGVGEYVAACLADVLSLEDALALVTERARLLQQQSQDGQLLPPTRRALLALASKQKWNAPRIPSISSLTGDWITGEQIDARAWEDYIDKPAQLARGLERLLEQPDLLLLEIGGQTLSQFARQHPTCARERVSHIVSTIPRQIEREPAMQALLNALGQLWLAGVEINWNSFSDQERRQRVVLPTYPFERQRYWLVPEGRNPASAEQERPAGEKLPDLRNWFFVPVWKQAPLAAARDTREPRPTSSCWLMLSDSCGLGEQISAQLRTLDQPVIIVQPGQEFRQVGEHAYTLRPTRSADYALLLKELHRRGQKTKKILHMWSLAQEEASGADQVEEMLSRGFYSLLALTQELGEYEDNACEINIISNGMLDVLGNERLNPLQATLLGPCRVIPQEYAHLRCRSIDILLPGPEERDAARTLARQLVGELLANHSEAVVALRGRRRWLPQFEPVPQDEVSHQHLPLRQRGVYLITGGLGGIGLAMAEFLAREYQARLVLVGRTALPPRAQWAALSTDHANTDQAGQRMRRVMELERLGADVLVLPADVANEAQMRGVIEQVEETYGEIHGVLHAAGVPGVGLIQFKTTEQAARVLAPKVQGTLSLVSALHGRQLDFLALFSSVTATTGGGPGQVDYCAANAFLGAFARSHSGEPCQTIAIDWSEWQWNAWEVGLSGYGEEARAYLNENRQRLGITFAEGCEAFQRSLATNLSHIVVSPQDFQQVAEQSKHFTAMEVLRRTRQQWSPRSRHQRPALASSYISPENELEQQIAAIWEELLGVSPIGLNDNFFELGGNSLLGIDLIGRLRRLCKLETLGAHVLYEAPTVGTQASYLTTTNQPDRTVDMLLERGKRRREGTRQLMYDTRRTR